MFAIVISQISPQKPKFVSAQLSFYAEPTTFDERNLQLINLSNNRFLPVATKFSYLGTTLNIDCRDTQDVIIIKKAGNVFGALRKCLFSNSNIPVDAKRGVNDRLILSILLYGAET